MIDKMSNPASGGPRKVEDDPYAELFADCPTVDDVVQLAADIAAMEAETPEA